MLRLAFHIAKTPQDKLRVQQVMKERYERAKKQNHEERRKA